MKRRHQNTCRKARGTTCTRATGWHVLLERERREKPKQRLRVQPVRDKKSSRNVGRTGAGSAGARLETCSNRGKAAATADGAFSWPAGDGGRHIGRRPRTEWQQAEKPTHTLPSKSSIIPMVRVAVTSKCKILSAHVSSCRRIQGRIRVLNIYHKKRAQHSYGRRGTGVADLAPRLARPACRTHSTPRAGIGAEENTETYIYMYMEI